MQITASFTRAITGDNIPLIVAKVKLSGLCADGLYKSVIMKKASGDEKDWLSREETFHTATEAETWAKTLCEKIRIEYTTARARMSALQIPTDFSIEED